MTETVLPGLDDGMDATDYALDHDIGTMVGVLRDTRGGGPELDYQMACALARTALRLCHDAGAHAYYRLLGRLMVTTNRELDEIQPWVERQLTKSGP